MNAEFNFEMRLNNLTKKILAEEVDAVLVSKTANLFYFSGFRGDSSVLLVGKNFCKLITDARYTEQAARQTKNFEIVKQTEGLFKKIEEEIKNCGIKKLGFEGKILTFAEYSHLKENLPEVELKSVELDELRQVKDAKEISLIRKACEIGDRAFAEILNFITAGVLENEVAAELEYLMKKFGAEKNSFDTIVASGVRGSLPHGVASDKKISAGEFVTLDFGAIYQGYCSDMTRTIFVGKVSENQQKLYSAVLDAQLYGLEVIKVGKGGKEIDAAVRTKLEQANLGEYFVHSLGHSLGIEIHEEPRLSKLSKCESLLENMIVTDEPGVYLPNVGGIRIEDTVLVTAGGAEPLTRSPKNLIEL